MLLVAEAMTPGGFYLLFFGIGAILVGLLQSIGLLNVEWMQWLVFSASSILALLIFRKRLLEKFKHTTPQTEVDQVAGETAVAIQSISEGEIGKVELRGTQWNAKNVGPNTIEAGQRCKVEKVDGLSLSVRLE